MIEIIIYDEPTIMRLVTPFANIYMAFWEQMVMLENKDFICVQYPTIQYFRIVLTKEKQKRTKSNLLFFSTS